MGKQRMCEMNHVHPEACKLTEDPGQERTTASYLKMMRRYQLARMVQLGTNYYVDTALNVLVKIVDNKNVILALDSEALPLITTINESGDDSMAVNVSFSLYQ